MLENQLLMCSDWMDGGDAMVSCCSTQHPSFDIDQNDDFLVNLFLKESFKDCDEEDTVVTATACISPANSDL